jgi:hypothetical protein
MGTCQLSPVRWISRLSTSVAQVTMWTQRFTEDVWQWYNMCAEHTWFKQFDPFYPRCAVSQALMRDRRGRRLTELVVRYMLRAPPHECPHVRELVAVVAHVVVGDDNDGPLAPHVYRDVDPVVVVPLALNRHFVDRVLLLQPLQNTLCADVRVKEACQITYLASSTCAVSMSAPRNVADRCGIITNTRLPMARIWSTIASTLQHRVGTSAPAGLMKHSSPVNYLAVRENLCAAPEQGHVGAVDDIVELLPGAQPLREVLSNVSTRTVHNRLGRWDARV